MFDTTKEDLKKILAQVDNGHLQLPDFQRDYVWNEEDVRSLIGSVAKGFPVGALLTLEVGGPVSFKPRLLEGVPKKEVQPDQLLLDGQQRMTSLYQTMWSLAPVKTRTAKGKEIERFYYIDIKKAVDPGTEFEDAIVGVPKDRIVKSDFGKKVDLDLSTKEREFEQDMFPLNRIFNRDAWLLEWLGYWTAQGRELTELYIKFGQTVVPHIDDYEMPIIRLNKKNSREAICLVFEKVNVGGKKLDAFELLTAIYAADEFNLREDWAGRPPVGGKPAGTGRHGKMLGQPPRDVLLQVANTDFLQACTLLHTMRVRQAKQNAGIPENDLPQVSCRRDVLLGLPLSSYEEFAPKVEDAFRQVATFLNERNIIWHKDIPYQPQLIALATVFAALGHKAQTVAARELLSRWFWDVALGELYGSTTESRLARDVPELIAWIEGKGPQPRSVDEALFQRDRLGTLRTRLAAAYKAIHALLMNAGAEDFISGKPTTVMTFANDQIDIHHIFPQHYCSTIGIPPERFNSVINKTPLSRLTNELIGGKAPSKYLKDIETKYGTTPDKLDAILRTHLIEPGHLRTDNFEAFFAARQEALAGLVSRAMGKPVVAEHGTNEPEQEPESIVPEFDEAELELAS